MTQEQYDKAQEVIKYSEGEVMQTPHLLLSLLRVYSDLFLNGKDPGGCEKCARTYYQKLKSMKMKPATCKLTENKIFHVRIGNAIVTYTNHNITDDAAFRMLINKQLNESDFTKLPDSYLAMKAENIVETVEHNEQSIEKKKRAKKA